jgi:hypothetical protein
MADADWEVNSSLKKTTCYTDKKPSLSLSSLSFFSSLCPLRLCGSLTLNRTDTSYRRLQLSQFSQRNPAAS